MRPGLASLLPLVSLVGCIEYDVVVNDGVDVFVQEPPEAVDILMIVDNSGSMAPYQDQLGQNFEQFISFFVGANVDYHIGVTTTDPGFEEPTPTTGCPNPPDPAAGRILGDVITPETDDPAATFQEIVNVGTCGSGFEMGLEAARMAVTEPLASDENAGFLREDATLSIIFVSDEEDSSPWPVNDYINEFFEIKGQRARNIFNASALTVTNEDKCTAEQAAASSPGDRYVDVAKQTNGLIGNLCAENFSDIVTELSLNVSQLHDTFYLSGEPDTSTLTVTVDETEIPCSDGAWTYQRLTLDGEEKPAVVFERDQMPEVGSKITVRYMSGGGDIEDFCTGGAE
jgi:hypothetical protein